MSHFESSIGERTLEMIDFGTCFFCFVKGALLEIRICYKAFGKDGTFKVDSNHINCSRYVLTLFIIYQENVRFSVGTYWHSDIVGPVGD
jgi:hypothetical protein